jgi:phenylacetic acid degradation operon negative regulatory protein
VTRSAWLTTVGDATADLLAGLAEGDLPTRLLVLGMARRDGTIHAAEVAPVAAACRRSPEQVRSCLRRLVAEGLFAREGTGPRAVYRPTPTGLAVLGAVVERARLALAQDRAATAWDGRWHLVAFAVPEARRADRDALRERVGALGGAAIHNGLYVSPHPWSADVVAAAERLGVAEHVTVATTDSLQVGGVTDPRAIAARLWPIEALAERYRRFVARWGPIPEQLTAMAARHEDLPDWALLPGALAMGLAYQSCFEADPLLPPELLPLPWPGRTARAVLGRSRDAARALRAGGDAPALFRGYDDLVTALAEESP